LSLQAANPETFEYTLLNYKVVLSVSIHYTMKAFSSLGKESSPPAPTFSNLTIKIPIIVLV
jgi:hypothetical protein